MEIDADQPSGTAAPRTISTPTASPTSGTVASTGTATSRRSAPAPAAPPPRPRRRARPRRGSGHGGTCGRVTTPVGTPPTCVEPQAPRGGPLRGRCRTPGSRSSRGSGRRRGRPGGPTPPPGSRTARRGPACITTTRSASANASSWSWVTKMIVSPRRTNSARSSATSRSRSARSSAPSGSSSMRSRGAGASARASATRCCSPPESSATLRCSKPSRPTSASVSSCTRFGFGARTTLHAEPEDHVADARRDAGRGRGPGTSGRTPGDAAAPWRDRRRSIARTPLPPARARRPRARACSCRSRSVRGRSRSRVRRSTRSTPSSATIVEPYAHRELVDLEHQNSPTDPTRKRSMARIASAVIAIRITLAAIAAPKLSGPGCPRSRKMSDRHRRRRRAAR